MDNYECPDPIRTQKAKISFPVEEENSKPMDKLDFFYGGLPIPVLPDESNIISLDEILDQMKQQITDHINKEIERFKTTIQKEKK